MAVVEAAVTTLVSAAVSGSNERCKVVQQAT